MVYKLDVFFRMCYYFAIFALLVVASVLACDTRKYLRFQLCKIPNMDTQQRFNYTIFQYLNYFFLQVVLLIRQQSIFSKHEEKSIRRKTMGRERDGRSSHKNGSRKENGLSLSIKPLQRSHECTAAEFDTRTCDCCKQPHLGIIETCAFVTIKKNKVKRMKPFFVCLLIFIVPDVGIPYFGVGVYSVLGMISIFLISIQYRKSFIALKV